MWITGLTALLAIGGIIYLWSGYAGDRTVLPYLDWLIGSVILEIVGIAFVFTKKGMKYLPDVQTSESAEETLKFMKCFVSKGSSATIVSNRVSWLLKDMSLMQELQNKISKGLRVEIITPQPVEPDIQKTLAGAKFIVTKETVPPDARFTLVNGDRSGAELLAIARGAHPNHEITIFDTIVI